MDKDYGLKKLENGDHGVVDKDGNVLCVVKDIEQFERACKETTMMLSRYETLLQAVYKLVDSSLKAMNELSKNLMTINVKNLDDASVCKVSFAQAALRDLYTTFAELATVVNMLGAESKENK